MNMQIFIVDMQITWYQNSQKLGVVLTLVNAGGGRNHHPLSEHRDFSTAEHPNDLRPVCKFKFVCCGPVDKKQSALSASV